MRRIGLGALVLPTCCGLVLASSTPSRDPSVVATADLFPLPLTRFVLPPSPPDAVALALGRGLRFTDRPSFGSGLAPLGGDAFMGVTDRGPNDDHPEVVGHPDGVLFPLPAFVPSMVHFTWRGSTLAVDAILPLSRADGRPISGLPNTPADPPAYDRPYGRGSRLQRAARRWPW